MNKQSFFVLSLDFEMMWGCADWATPNDYGESNVRNVRNVVDRMLTLFEYYGIRATFATVGLLLCRDKDEALSRRPTLRPSYIDAQKSPYRNGYIDNINDKDAELYFAPDLIERLKQCDNIEIGSHTFCHYYCSERGQSIEQFRADMEAMQSIANDNGIKISSIVFPKNQVSQEYVEACGDYEIKYYRGNSNNFFDVSAGKFSTIKNRLCRLIDTYVKIGGRTSYTFDKIGSTKQPLNVPASRFLRPYDRRLSLFERMKLRRIKNEMKNAAQRGEVYHLWFHPHNMGSDMENNLSNLEDIFKCYVECHRHYGMQSCTMAEIANKL